MTTELHILAWTLVLALIQVLLPSVVRSRETGLGHNGGPRDQPGPPVGKVTGRLMRAQNNLFETLPVFAIAILIAHLAGREGTLTLYGAWLYIAARGLPALVCSRDPVPALACMDGLAFRHHSCSRPYHLI
jgi:uncharacterized MAPEG superfamily protein